MIARFIATSMWIVLSMTFAWAQTVHPISITSDGWTVTADSGRSALSVSHDKLGTVFQDVEFNLKSGEDLYQLKDWTVQKIGPHQLSIRTESPRTAWVVELSPNILKVSSTSGQAILTAQAPASPDRVVARLMDSHGIPVDWEGTREVADGYGGKQTQHASFLPQRNSECMYFGLGPVSSLNLHSLFDRKTDIAIRFSDQTRMRRDQQNGNFLDLTIPVPVNTLVQTVPDYYTKVLGAPYYAPFDDSHFPKAPVAWNSWDNYYGQVTEKAIVQNTDWIARNLKAYGFQYVVLDDGYDRGKNGVHYWIKNWNRQKFPHGPRWLANYIKSKGLLPGVWLVPNSYEGAIKEHPDWYLHYKNGKTVLDYRTPALDSTNPQVLDFLKREFTILDNWGFDYYKFDGEYAIPEYVPNIEKSRLYNKSMPQLVAYRNRLKLIRGVIGPGRFIEGCPAGTPLNGVGYFDSYFNGQDMRPSWQGGYALFSSINGNAFLNHIVVYVMPGEGIDVSPHMSVAEATKKRVSDVIAATRSAEDPMKGFGSTTPEARTLTTYVALTGVVYPVSSVMPELPPERVKLLKMTLPTLPILPIDLFSRGSHIRWDTFKHATPDYYVQNYPRILDLKVNAQSGIYDVVGMTNWEGRTITRELSFRNQLGLNPSSSYIAFDFWNQKLYGVFEKGLKAEIKPHDTRVFLIHPDLHRPELIGTSRHITGAYSILARNWDSAQHTLSGSSRTVPGEEYTLWIYVPEGLSPFRVSVRAADHRQVPVHHELHEKTLSVSFPGQQRPVDWEIRFHTNGAN